MDWRELREQCLALPGSVEEFPFGDEVSVFKVGGKMFALSHLDGDPLQLSVKCDPELAVQLRAAYLAIAPGYHMNKRHWNTITLDGSVADPMVCELLGDSYDLVVASLPKARRPDAGPGAPGTSRADCNSLPEEVFRSRTSGAYGVQHGSGSCMPSANAES